MYYHRKAILEEAVRQKTEKDWINWDKMSSISKESSAPQAERAAVLGKEDEKERIRIWSQKAEAPKTTTADAEKDKKSKRKSSFFGIFKKKWCESTKS